jgi:CHRD domain
MKHVRISFWRGVVAGFLALGVVFTVHGATPTSSETIDMTASLSPKSEVPPVESNGTGSVNAKFDKKTSMLNYTITFSNLTGAVTAAHFHGPAPVGKNAGVAMPIKGAMTSPITGGVTLNAAQSADLLAGLWYVNLHSAANPNGEIRGQIITQP